MDTSFLSGMRYLPPIGEPFVGETIGFKHQTKVNDFSTKSRVIAGRGVKVKETPQGLIVEASNITEKHEYYPAPTMFIAKVKSNTNGVILADLYLNGLLDDEAIYATDVQIFSTINNTWQKGLEAGDCILVTAVTTLTAGVLEENNEEES